MEGLGSRSPGRVELFALTLLTPDLISKVEESQRHHQFRLLHIFINRHPQVLSILITFTGEGKVPNNVFSVDYNTSVILHIVESLITE